MTTVTDILEADLSMRDRARLALGELDRLPHNDTAREDYRAAAQTFALLAVADSLDEQERATERRRARDRASEPML